MKVYSYRVTIKTDAEVTALQLMRLIEDGVGCANGCTDPEEMINGEFTVHAEPLRKGA